MLLLLFTLISKAYMHVFNMKEVTSRMREGDAQ